MRRKLRPGANGRSMKRKIAITGTSKGLGLALARQFTELGHQVFGGARTPPEQLDADVPGSYQQLDVTDSESQQLWWDKAQSELEGLPDLVIANAAAINENAPLWDVPEAEFRKVVEVNVTGVYLTLKHFVNRWIESPRKKSVIVALSSGWGRSTSPDVAPYCTTKWAVEGMIGALSQELPQGLTAVALNPGIINTEMLRSCFGTSASQYSKPEVWARSAATQILSFERESNGVSATIVESPDGTDE
jgi:NAD(P)-dependent dehydrogenase (short-subunit alcohol dehydrogenase family)